MKKQLKKLLDENKKPELCFITEEGLKFDSCEKRNI